jgi:hypothetical protein
VGEGAVIGRAIDAVIALSALSHHDAPYASVDHLIDVDLSAL